ncbi:MAG TPA: TIM-barrel domain-containing protein, partial [Polyangiaceae bacterium]|nr:TIM-barrel domain-containing protein [Polyangiaceae bacterium]
GADGGPPHLSVQRTKQVGTNGGYVIFEVLDDGLVHFELSSTGTGPDATAPLAVSPQVARTDYDGPTRFVADATSIETSTVHIAVDPATLCLALSERGSSATLTTLCPSQLGQAGGGISLTPQATHTVYGLGEDFLSVNQPNGDWLGKQRLPGDMFGNKMVPFDGANAGNAQFPILYATNSGSASYALFLDDAHAQKYFFDANPWKVQTGTSPFRAYWFVAPALPALRSSYMDLTGRPPVPPKKAFGLWVSEYGYENWGELEDKFNTLRQNQFPVDGFVLDLLWFGGVTDTAASSMGGLSWDLTNFPDPAGKLASYRAEGIGIINIEESYVAAGRGEYGDLAGRGFLVRDGCATCDPTSLSAWWGIGGMIDWTLDAAGDYWHDLKRQPLIGVGVLGHWIDLGEPEEYSPSDWVNGFAGAHAHGDYQNLYGFSWARSIARGYTRNSVAQRAFILSRTGTSGIQRFGAAMWSGDVASKLSTLATHMNAQMQMSMSGMDYFGADIGGFRRDVRTPGEDLNTMYTQWFAAGLWTDVPVRPHTANLKDTSETAPDRIGDFASNLANLRQRYELVPYYYSLAHRAYRFGEPVVPPPAFYYQDDANVRGLGSEKMIGRDMIVALVADAAATTRDVYLPAGDWVNYQTNAWLHSTGQTFAAQPLTVGGVYRVPAYVRAGAILPKMFVDAQTRNVLGLRADGTTRNELTARVYAAATQSSFTVYEDDGETPAYLTGAVRETVITQQLQGSTETVTMAAATGTYANAPSTRSRVVELVANGQSASAVTVNGTALSPVASVAAFGTATSGWVVDPVSHVILAKSATLDVTQSATFIFTLTTP